MRKVLKQRMRAYKVKRGCELGTERRQNRFPYILNSVILWDLKMESQGKQSIKTSIFCRQILFKTSLGFEAEERQVFWMLIFCLSALSISPSQGSVGITFLWALAPFLNSFLAHISPHCTLDGLPKQMKSSKNEECLFLNAQYLDNVWHRAGIQ